MSKPSYFPPIWDSDRRSEFVTIPAGGGNPMETRFFVYILANKPRGVLYVGVTNSLPRRISEHQAKVVPGFTDTYGVTRLVHYEEHSSILEARRREYAVKRWRREWKFKLIEELNPDWRDLTDQSILL